MPEKLLTIKEAASELGVSEEKLKELTEQGRIPVYKVGGVFLRYDKKDLSLARERISSAGPHKDEPAVSEAGEETPEITFGDKLLDFLYFNDFYIISVAIILVILYVIFHI